MPCAELPSMTRSQSSIDARAIGEYDGALREIIHALKYSGRRSLAQPHRALMRRVAATFSTGPTASCRFLSTGAGSTSADSIRRMNLPVISVVPVIETLAANPRTRGRRWS